MRPSTRIGLGVAAIALAAAGAVATSQPASAKPDTSCQLAGISTLQGAGLIDDASTTPFRCAWSWPTTAQAPTACSPTAGADAPP